MRILLMGPPGSGKGTQGSLLSAAFGVPVISTGDIFREHVRRSTPLGRDVEQVMASGSYVPDEVTNALVEDRLAAPDVDQGFILDGYPRTTNQVAELDRVLARSDSRLGAVVHLSVPADELVSRLHRRGSRGDRADDRAETIRGRIALYEAVTIPLLDNYRERGVLVDVDGRGEPVSVAAELERRLRALIVTPS